MGRITEIGTHIRLPDGRLATVVFHGLSGVGIKFGLHKPKKEDFAGTSGDLFEPTEDAPCRQKDWPWHMDAMLREAAMAERLGVPCVGGEFEILEEAEDE